MESEIKSKEEQLIHQFDWKLLKEILQGIANTVNSLCKVIPDPLIRNIVCGLGSVLQMIISMLPAE